MRKMSMKVKLAVRIYSAKKEPNISYKYLSIPTYVHIFLYLGLRMI